MILTVNLIISLNRVNQLISVTVKSGVFFAVRTELLNVIYTSFGFKYTKLPTRPMAHKSGKPNGPRHSFVCLTAGQWSVCIGKVL
jgi:hypothetical protein